MFQMRDLRCNVQRLTPDDGHYFFGYYDVPAWSKDECYHLCHRVNFWDRLPGADDVATLGIIRVSDREFIPFAETKAWNFQQGSMLQWLPYDAGKQVIYNMRSDDKFIGVIKSIETGKERFLDRPVAAVSLDGDYALSINFSRVLDFRPGYGYAGIPDPYVDEDYPPDDGVFLIDLASGQSRLIISYDEILRVIPSSMVNDPILINHIKFNTDGTRFLMLVRNNPRDKTSKWTTVMFTANLDGSDIYCLHDCGLISHYDWRDRDHVLCYCDTGRADGLYLLADKTTEVELIDDGFFLSDGHCSYSPDRNMLLYDSYPSQERYRSLYAYDLINKRGRTLGGFYSPQETNVDIRTDMHPRWSRSGHMISFDSTHEGFRGIYLADIDR